MSNNNVERDTQLMSVGQQCSESSCLLVDFLPFKCQHCSKSFCGEHFLAAAHNCPQYDESKHNRVAPSCPLCNTPVAIPPGQDPNIRMECHINTECSVTTGKSGRTRSQPVCARGKCGKVLYAPIACDACKKQFCPQHRFPKDHSCSNLASTAAPSSNSLVKSSLASFKLPVKTFTTQTSNASGSRTRTSPSSSGASASSNVVSSPFSKTGRRAKAERESRRKAMVERAKKGLLTEQEKLLLAEEEAQRAKEVSSETDKDCAIM